MTWDSLFFAGASNGLIESALLVCMFWTALVHPERIRGIWRFRLAAIFLGISLSSQLLAQTIAVERFEIVNLRDHNHGAGERVFIYSITGQRVVTMLAVLLALDSVLPGLFERRRGKDSAEAAATRS